MNGTRGGSRGEMVLLPLLLLRACHVRRTSMTQFPKDLQPKHTHTHTHTGKVAQCPSLQDVLYMYAGYVQVYAIGGLCATHPKTN